MSVGKTIGIVVVLVLIVLGIYFIGFHKPSSVTRSGYLLAFQLTDPPQVPSGTQSLEIHYSSLQAHTSTLGWLNSNDSGSIDLLSLTNLSQTIGTISVPNGTTIDAVRFNVTSATIDINNTDYNVTLTSKTITAKLSGNANVTSASSVLLSMSPTVVSILTGNSTVFVLVPSVAAVVLPYGTNQTTSRVGYKSRITNRETEYLDNVKPNITISNTLLSVLGNTTSLSVTVENTGNKSAVIKHLSLFGNASVNLNLSSIASDAHTIQLEARDRIRNSTICSNISTGISNTSNLTVQISDERPSFNASVGVGTQFNSSNFNLSASNPQGDAGDNSKGNAQNVSSGDHGNQSQGVSSEGGKGNANESKSSGEFEDISEGYGVNFNNNMCTNAGLTEFENELRARIVNVTSTLRDQQIHFRVFSFLISNNGTLEAPYVTEDFNDTGYTLASGKSFTFTFTGVISTSESHLVITPILGNNYTINVGGEEGASASTNVTATS